MRKDPQTPLNQCRDSSVQKGCVILPLPVLTIHTQYIIVVLHSKRQNPGSVPVDRGGGHGMLTGKTSSPPSKNLTASRGAPGLQSSDPTADRPA